MVGISDLFIGGSAAAELIGLGLRPAAAMAAIFIGLLTARHSSGARRA